MSEQITPEMYEEFRQKQEAEKEAQALKAEQTCINALVALAAEHGFTIIAIPQMKMDARLECKIAAQWGVKRQ
jgi:hypothetical protein